jgi:hypothetical protein
MREINPDLRPGAESASTSSKKNVPGGPGFQWRMMRLRRVYETAEEEGRNVEEVALEKYGSLEAFNEAIEEKRILDERAGNKNSSKSQPGKKSDEPRYSFQNTSGPPSRGSFRKPGQMGDSDGSTGVPSAPTNKRLDSVRTMSGAATPQSTSNRSSQQTPLFTPIPSVMTPQLPSTPPVDLNKLQAKVLRAKLTGAANAAELEREYEEAKKRSEGLFDAEGQKLQVLPTIDGQGRLYDVGTGNAADEGKPLPGNRRKKEKVCLADVNDVDAQTFNQLPETRDPKTGELLRYNEDDDTTTLGDMLRQEKFGAGMADQKDLDNQFARAIMSDGKFQVSLDRKIYRVFLLMSTRTIWNIWTTMLRGLVVRRCVMML